MEQTVSPVLEHLRYERNVSEHTLRNYASDLNQFLDHLAGRPPENREENGD
jgi:site-specific recombinase XerD